jgi:BAG domain
MNTFKTTWLPVCQRFISSPPSDPVARDKEYKKLSESVLAQVVLKADVIDTEGNPECRAMRKQLVNEANEIMKALDVVGRR